MFVKTKNRQKDFCQVDNYEIILGTVPPFIFASAFHWANLPQTETLQKGLVYLAKKMYGKVHVF